MMNLTMILVGYSPFLRDFTVYLILFALTYAFSLVFLDFYTGGDQVYYTRFFEAAVDATLEEIASLQVAHTGSSEPLFGITIWGAAHAFPKIEFVAFTNSILVCMLVAGLRRLHAYPIYYPLILTNYYLFVLLLSAERLKFACIALLAFGIVSGLKRYIFLAAAPLFHFQAVLFASVAFGEKVLSLLKGLLRLQLRPIPFIVLGLSSIAALAIYLAFQDIIGFKSSHYSSHGITGIYKSLLLSICGIVLASRNDRSVAFFTFAPLIIAAYRFGDNRVNIVTFTFFMYFLLRADRGLNLFAVIPLLYFSIKGVVFLSDVSRLGTGFPQ